MHRAVSESGVDADHRPRAIMQAATDDIRRIIEGHLVKHLKDRPVDSLMDAVVRGEVVHRVEGRPSIIALRNGILFVAGREYVIGDA
jgi:hypothetical protein